MIFKRRACMPSTTENVWSVVSRSNSRKWPLTTLHRCLWGGGTNDIKNLQLACKCWSSMKRNMTMDDMIEQISEILKYNRKQKLIKAFGGIVEWLTIKKSLKNFWRRQRGNQNELQERNYRDVTGYTQCQNLRPHLLVCEEVIQRREKFSWYLLILNDTSVLW